MSYRAILVVVVPVLFLSSSLFIIDAADICIPDRLGATSVDGQVVTLLAKGEGPVPGASLELREDRYKGRTIAKSESDAHGRFALKNIQPGKYILTVTYPQLKRIDVPIQIVKGRQSKNSRREIVVALGSDFTKPCGGGYAKIRKPSGLSGSPFHRERRNRLQSH